MIGSNPQSAVERCPLCGEPLGEMSNECSKCDWFRGYRHQETERAQRDPRDVASALLSIVPGAGHLFKGHLMLGWILMLLVAPMVLVMAGALTIYFGWLILPVYWLGVACDAYFRKDLRAAAAKARLVKAAQSAPTHAPPTDPAI